MRLKYDFSFQQYDDRYMAIADYKADETDLRLLWVNAVGKEIMELLQNDRSIAEVITEMEKRYTANDDEIEVSVKKFIRDLDKAGFLDFL